MVKLTLMNADTDQPISDLNVAGTVIDLKALPTRNINFKATTEGTVGSVKFRYGVVELVEAIPPISYPGDTGGNLIGFTPAVGQHVLRAEAYSEAGAKGTMMNELVIPLTVKDGDVVAEEILKLKTRLAEVDRQLAEIAASALTLETSKLVLQAERAEILKKLGQ